MNSNWSYSPETPNLGQIRRFLEPCDLEIKLCVSFHHHMWIQTGVSPETVMLGCDLCDLDLWPLTLTFCMDHTLVLGDNSWKFHDDTMMGNIVKKVWQTDRWTDENTIHRAAWSQLKIKWNNRLYLTSLRLITQYSQGLTPCGLTMPYGHIDLGQHWLR